MKLLIAQVADRVALQVEDSGNFECHRAASAAYVDPVTQRRHRFDFHAKGFAVHLVTQQKLARTSSFAGSSMDKVHRSKASHGVMEEMAAFQAATHFSFERGDIFAMP